jgi:hypothetical protein
VSGPGERTVEAEVAELGASLERGFAALEGWLATPEPLWSSAPAPGAWSVREVLEHLALMQRFVLLLVDKVGERALRRRAEGAALPARLDPLVELDELARRGRRWPHPEHMSPTARAARQDLARELGEQRKRCRQWLERLPHGEGALHSLRMSVVGRRLDLYGWLRLVERHLWRHLRQLERTRAILSAEPPDAGP